MADLPILPALPVPAASARSGARSLSGEPPAPGDMAQSDQEPFQAVLAQELTQAADSKAKSDGADSAALKNASENDDADPVADKDRSIEALFPAFTLVIADDASAQKGIGHAEGAALAGINTRGDSIAGEKSAKRNAGLSPIEDMKAGSDSVQATASPVAAVTSGQVGVAALAMASGVAALAVASGVDNSRGTLATAGRALMARDARQAGSANAVAVVTADSQSSAVSTAAEFAGSGKFVPAAGEILREPGFAEYLTERPQPAPLPPAALQGAAAISAAPSSQPSPAPAAFLEARVGTTGWDQALGDKMVWMAGRSHQVAQLHLNPPELGPLQITLTIDHDQASAQFTSAHAQVREAIETAMPRLREMLADSGITLGNASVSADLPREQSQPHMQREALGYPLPSGNTAVEEAFERRGTRLLQQSRGLVDTFA